MLQGPTSQNAICFKLFYLFDITTKRTGTNSLKYQNQTTEDIANINIKYSNF
jgi:hypothetical protein